MNKPKRVVVVSDQHAGHIVGLTPPSWDIELPITATEELAKPS